MREVNPNMNHQKTNVKEILNYLKEFVKNPVLKITEIPSWDWMSLIIVQITFAVVSGVLAGAIKLNLLRALSGIFLMPIVSTVSSMLLTTFFYYYFQFFENRTESYRRLFAFVTLASIPFYIFQIASEYFPPVTLIGFGFTSLLCVVGLTENFQVDRKRAYQIAVFLYLLVLATWLLNKYI
ncbi:YIP1 family protein [Pseudobdellovibrio sp. HCB154]|uniref:YIP1 family protein n=1 Tax=Pseudobdellovibrio sp. HCB154 TaxID=3386277 RepID=UPI0039172D62